MSVIFEALKAAERERTRASKGSAQVIDPTEKSASTSDLSQDKNVPKVTKTRDERRRQKRAPLNLSARFRPADAKDGSFQEILATVNASRAGLYFITGNSHFYVGMRLRVTFPYNSAHDSVANTENSGQIVRIDKLKDGRFGVAVIVQGPAEDASFTQPAQAAAHSTRTTQERRRATRYPFSATALVIEGHTEARLQARCSDLSLEGCYLDTLNPFRAGTRVLLQLEHKGQTFETVAQVSASHVGMGMGVVFREPEPEQVATLVDWLCVHHSGEPARSASHGQTAAQPSGAKESVPPSTQAEPSATDRDRELLLGLFRLLQSQGVLKSTKDEAKAKPEVKVKPEVLSKPIL